MSVGPPEILVILILALVVFGPKRLPEVGRQVGAAVRELRRMQDTVRGELDMVLHPEHGTRTADASTEPGDHSTGEPGDHSIGEPDHHSIGEPGEIEPEEREMVDVVLPELEAPEPTPADPTDEALRFRGPPDSFI